MGQSVKEKIWVLAVSFVLFIGAVAALFLMHPGLVRTSTLCVAITAMLCIAARQTIVKIKKTK